MDERVIGADLYNVSLTGGVSKTLNAIATDSDHVPVVICDVAYYTMQALGHYVTGEVASSLKARDYKDATDIIQHNVQPSITANGTGALCMESYQTVTGALCAAEYSKLGLQEAANDIYAACLYDGSQIAPTLTRNNASGSQRMPDKENFNAVIEKANQPRKYILRRLTPIECARLQGFPDWWTDGANGSDSAIYKMWGNGIALPCAADVIGRLAKELETTN